MLMLMLMLYNDNHKLYELLNVNLYATIYNRERENSQY